MDRVGLVGLVKIELPGAYGDVLLSDAGFQVWGAETYKSADAVFGSIGSVETLGEGVGDEVPALSLTLLPPSNSNPGDLTQPGFQTARARFWVAEYDVEDHSVVGTPDLLFDGQLDRTVLRLGMGSYEMELSVVSLAERLFELNMGNSLNPAFHKSVWAGELGHDNATGMSIPVAWGTTSPTTSANATTTSPYYGTKRSFSEYERL